MQEQREAALLLRRERRASIHHLADVILECERSVLGAELVDALTDGRVPRSTLEAGLLGGQVGTDVAAFSAHGEAVLRETAPRPSA
jgi:hypothetical protein